MARAILLALFLLLRGSARGGGGDGGTGHSESRAGNSSTHAQDGAGYAPRLHYTFIEQALRGAGGGAAGAGGADVSLRCAARALPPPRFTWLLDEAPLHQQLEPHRYTVSESLGSGGEVASELRLRAAPGGLYKCRAENQHGAAKHAARLNIYGLPSIRPMGVARLVAGLNATVLCPYAGYPISAISWRRLGAAGAGAAGAVGAAGRVSARGAMLSLRPARVGDAGRYACTATAPDGASATRDLEIQIRNPPKISPFIFSTELTEGSSVQVLCGVISGDKPMYFSWLKDEAPLPSNLQIEEKSLNEFSLLMFSGLTARHSGAYTCRVSNHAATVNYTATLTVKVPPSWSTEPGDAAVLLGARARLACAAAGHPPPDLAWLRRVATGLEAGSEHSDHWEMVVSGTTEGVDSAGVVGAAGGVTTAVLETGGGRDAAGVYRCRADNGVGPPLFKDVNLTVHAPAQVEVPAAAARNVSAVRGAAAALTCAAAGDPPLELHWTHRGARVQQDSYRWAVREARGAGGGARSTLHVRAAAPADAGEYRCHATNPFGRSDVIIYLNVEEPPPAPRALRLGGVAARWVRVRWRGGRGARGAQYSALVALLPARDHRTTNVTLHAEPDQDGSSADEQGYSAVVSGLRPAAAYSLRLTAADHVGRSPASEPLLFTTLEEAPTGMPQDVRARATSNDELLVSWSPPPQDSWNGELLGYVVSWRAAGGVDGAGEGGAADEQRGGRRAALGWGGGELALTELLPFTRYALSVRAFNCAGAGPAAPTLTVTTADGVPEEPPSDVQCEVLSAHSLRVRWSPPARAPALAAAAPSLHGFDVLYAPYYNTITWSGLGAEAAAAAAGGAALLAGLAAGTNYSLAVRARGERGVGPRSRPVYCATLDDVPAAPTGVAAAAAGADALLVAWRAPPGPLTHYTLHLRELAKSGSEWSVQVGGGAGGAGCAHARAAGLARAPHALWLRAHSRAGPGAPSLTVTAMPSDDPPTRLLSPSTSLVVEGGARVRLCCTTAGGRGAVRAWCPLPRPPAAHAITDTGDLVIHGMDYRNSGNYTCSLRGREGAWSVTHSVLVAPPPPAPPAPRLARASRHKLHLVWDPVVDTTASIIGYTVWWSVGSGAPQRRAVGARGDAVLAGLPCGAAVAVTLTAHTRTHASPHSPPLRVTTKGERPVAAGARATLSGNSSALLVSLLAWRAECGATWRVAVRPADSGAAWRDLPADGDVLQATGLPPGTWHEVRVQARSPAGATLALYRAATLTADGERIGEPVEIPVEADSRVSDVTGPARAAWRGALSPALLAGALLALAGAAGGAAWQLRRHPGRQPAAAPHPAHSTPLYTTEPGKRNEKSLSPLHDGSLHEISPYATFSMGAGGTGGAGGAGGAVSCALHSFGRAEPPGLAALPPPLHNGGGGGGGGEGGAGRDSDSSSSSSLCVACAAHYSHHSDTLPMDSSCSSTTYTSSRAGHGSRGARAARVGRGAAAGAGRRGKNARHSAPTARYFPASPPPRAVTVTAASSDRHSGEQ